MSDQQPATSLMDRFPALRRLRGARTGKIPFVQQHSNVECGVACMAMVLGYHGKHVNREELRTALGPTRDGVRAAHLLKVARYFGLQARGFKGDLDALKNVPAGSILHWQFNHFVVLQRVTKEYVDVVDPAMGPRRMNWKDMDKAFTGVVLMFEPGSDFTPSKGKPKRKGIYHHMLKAGDWGRILTMSFALQLITLALPMLIALIVDRVLPRGDEQLLFVVAFGLVLIFGFHWLSVVVRGHLLLNMRTAMDAKMSMEMLDRLLALPYSYFQQRSVGDLIIRLESSSTIREILTGGMMSTVLDGTLMLIYLGLLSMLSPVMSVVVLLLGGVNMGLLWALRGKRRAFEAEMIERQTAHQDYTVEMLNAVQTIKSMGCEHRAQERWGNLFVDTLNTALAAGRLEVSFGSLTKALRMGAPLLIFTLGAMEVLSGSMSVGTMLAVNTFAVGVFDPLSRLVERLEEWERLKIYMDRIMDVHDSPREQPLGRQLLHDRLSGGIRLENVSFRHGPLDDDVLQRVNLEIQPGEFVGIVGASGAGKSTLASLILGLYQPTVGRVFYDDRSMQDIDLRSLREQVGVVTQDTHLFAGSIRQNIALANPELTQEEVEEAARLAQIHDDIARMPMGYYTVLATAGSSISGGQRQRVALARALVRKPAILVLDEATSALDARSERGIQDALADIRCTRIVIAHRLSTVAQADRIVVMDQGRIVEQGSPLELLERGAAYARLMGQQAQSMGGGAAPASALPNGPAGGGALGNGGPETPPEPEPGPGTPEDRGGAGMGAVDAGDAEDGATGAELEPHREVYTAKRPSSARWAEVTHAGFGFGPGDAQQAAEAPEQTPADRSEVLDKRGRTSTKTWVGNAVFDVRSLTKTRQGPPIQWATDVKPQNIVVVDGKRTTKQVDDGAEGDRDSRS